MATKPRHKKTTTQLWIADNRKRLGLVPADLAVLTGVSEATARSWESRGHPSEDAMVALERRFGVPRPEDGGGLGDADLAAAIRDLTVELAQMRLEREAWRRGVLSVLQNAPSEQVSRDLLGALAAQLPEPAQP